MHRFNAGARSPVCPVIIWTILYCHSALGATVRPWRVVVFVLAHYVYAGIPADPWPAGDHRISCIRHDTYEFYMQALVVGAQLGHGNISFLVRGVGAPLMFKPCWQKEQCQLQAYVGIPGPTNSSLCCRGSWTALLVRVSFSLRDNVQKDTGNAMRRSI